MLRTFITVFIKIIQAEYSIYSRAAQNVLISLNENERENAAKLISLASENLQKGTSFKGFAKLNIPGRELFSIRLSDLLRIIIEKVGSEIKVIDIVNAGLRSNPGNV